MMITGVEEVESSAVQEVASHRIKQEFIDHPVRFIRNKDEIVENNLRDFVQLRQGYLELTPIELDELEPLYTVGRDDGRKLNPYRFRERNVDSLMEFWDREMSDQENIDLEYAEQVLKGERSGTKQGVQERFNLQPHSEEALEKSKEPVYDAVAEELIQTLYGQAMNKNERFKEEVEAFERALKKFDPEPYLEVVDNNHTYSVEHLTETDEMMVSADASGSCIRNRESEFEEYAEDEYSMISAVRKDGETFGYLRNFLMEDEEGREFLAVDTIEIDHKNFEENKDVVRAAGMASIQMMYDLEADYLVGSDARVKYGVRQAYSNTEKSVRGQKLGERDIRSYSFNTIEDVDKSAYLLMDNPGR